MDCNADSVLAPLQLISDIWGGSDGNGIRCHYYWNWSGGQYTGGKLPSDMKVAVIDSRGYGGHVPTGGVTPRRSW